MKKLQICVIVVFLLVLLVPVSQFNFEEHAASAIDNRMLTDNPFQRQPVSNEAGENQTEPPAESIPTVEEQFTVTYTTNRDKNAKRVIHSYPPYSELVSSASVTTSNLTGDLTTDIENYVNDRIGFRDEMILGYIVLNDRLFGKMVHPSYTYGKDGWVFDQALWVNHPFTEYHEIFADMILDIQNFCEARGVPFLFAFNPSKPAVYEEYIAEGINYDRSWVTSLLDALDERGIHYVDTTPVLREKAEEGEMVFNKQYDANHWNALGAYYGTYAILEELKKTVPTVHLTAPEELTIDESVATSLLVSQLPIQDPIPVISIDAMEVQSLTSLYNAELYRNKSYNTIFYYVNQQRIAENGPRVLVFQGSHMNGQGKLFFENAFGEYISIHNYQNVIEFEYYYSIFQPDCVIFETSEPVLSETYFNSKKMQQMDLNPFIEDVDEKNKDSSVETISVTRSEALTSFLWPCDTDDIDYAWITINGQVYDMYRTENGFEVTLKTEDYHANQNK